MKFKIDISIWLFIVVGVSALILITIGFMDLYNSPRTNFCREYNPNGTRLFKIRYIDLGVVDCGDGVDLCYSVNYGSNMDDKEYRRKDCNETKTIY